MNEDNKVVSLTKEDLESILNKYFKTLEQQSKDLEEQNKIDSENALKEQEKIDLQNLSDEEYRQELITLLKENNYNTQFNNNLMYFSIVTVGTILICTLMYKFLKIFM